MVGKCDAILEGEGIQCFLVDGCLGRGDEHASGWGIECGIGVADSERSENIHSLP